MRTLEQLVMLAALLLFGYVLWQWAQQSPGNASRDAFVTRSAGIMGQAVRVAKQSPTAPAIAPAPVTENEPLSIRLYNALFSNRPLPLGMQQLGVLGFVD